MTVIWWVFEIRVEAYVLGVVEKPLFIQILNFRPNFLVDIIQPGKILFFFEYIRFGHERFPLSNPTRPPLELPKRRTPAPHGVPLLLPALPPEHVRDKMRRIPARC